MAKEHAGRTEFGQIRSRSRIALAHVSGAPRGPAVAGQAPGTLDSRAATATPSALAPWRRDSRKAFVPIGIAANKQSPI